MSVSSVLRESGGRWISRSDAYTLSVHAFADAAPKSSSGSGTFCLAVLSCRALSIPGRQERYRRAYVLRTRVAGMSNIGETVTLLM